MNEEREREWKGREEKERGENDEVGRKLDRKETTKRLQRDSKVTAM
jgi:hypothetical protein